MASADFNRDLVEYFERAGYVYLRAAIERCVAAELAGEVWGELLRRHAIHRGDPSTWTVAEPRGLGSLRAEGAFGRIGSPAVRHGIEALAGSLESATADCGGPLVTFPLPGHWGVPCSGWHLDYPVRGAPESQLRLKWLVFLEPVDRHGGGTVVISGFHHLVNRWLQDAEPNDPGKSPAVRDAIYGTHPWLRLLQSKRAAAEPDPARDRRLMDDGAEIHGHPFGWWSSLASLVTLSSCIPTSSTQRHQTGFPGRE